MKGTPIPAVLSGRKDKLWLRKTFCRRVGLHLTLKERRQAFGHVSYDIHVPKDLSADRVVRAVRSQRTRRRLLKLSHITGRLLVAVGLKVWPPGKITPWKRKTKVR